MQKLNNLLVLVFISSLTVSCGIQSIPQSKNAMEASLAEVTNQYKRRADLVPNLVSTVKGMPRTKKKHLKAL